MRHFLHVLISILMWCLFGYYWYVVSGREIGHDTRLALGVLALVIVVGLLLTLWWVAHNKKLARRNRRSTPPPLKPEPFDKDNLGRTIEAPDRAVLRDAPIVEVAVIRREGDQEYGGIKTYTPIYRQGVK